VTLQARVKERLGEDQGQAETPQMVHQTPPTRLVQRNHSRIPAATEGPGEQRLRTQHPKAESTHHETIQATQTTNLHPLPTQTPRQPLADRHQILRQPVPHSLPRRLLTLPHRHRPPQRSHNQQNPPPPRRNPSPRKNTETDPQRSRHTILQRRWRKQIHNLPRSPRHRTHHGFHWKTYHTRQDRTILPNIRTLLSTIQQPHTIQTILQPETPPKPKLPNPSRGLPQPMSLQNVLDSRSVSSYLPAFICAILKEANWATAKLPPTGEISMTGNSEGLLILPLS
jgi:hypothetical protein